MKFFALFATVLAVASAYEPISTWSLNQLSEALQDPATDPAIVPYLEKALNQLMENIFTGIPQTTITVSIPVTNTYTLEELSEVLRNPETNPALKPYLEAGLDALMTAVFSGQNAVAVKIHIPAMNVNTWSLEQISYALRDPNMSPELRGYLEYALDHLMQAIFDGQNVLTIDVVTPPGVNAVAPVIPDESNDEEIAPEAVAVPEITPAPVPVPAPAGIHPTPSPVNVPEEPPVSSAPLVQLILNVNVQ